MSFVHNDIATKQRLRDALNEEGSMGFEHNDIVTTDVMNKAIAEGGGGGGGDFSTAKVTITVNAGSGVGGLSGGIGGTSDGFAFIKDIGGVKSLITVAGADAGDTVTADAVLVDGLAWYDVMGTITETSGAVTVEDEQVLITGDCSITLDPTT